MLQLNKKRSQTTYEMKKLDQLRLLDKKNKDKRR